MKLEDCRKAYYGYSEKTSELVRNLAFAGIAIVWVFKIGSGPNYCFSKELLLPIILLIVTLTLHMLHYTVATAIWGIYHGIKEKKGTQEEAEFRAPRWINWCSLAFFWLKVIAIILSYIYLIVFACDFWSVIPPD